MGKGLLLAFGFILIVIRPVTISAQTPSSSNYSVKESSFSSGSNTNATSTTYSARISAGDLGVGSANSTSYGARVGPISPSEEYLEMSVTGTTIDLGTLSDLATSSGFGNFYVRAYLNSSYTVVTMSNPPTSESGNTIAPIVSASISSIGTEQFGINLVDNATPNVGANPAPDPSASFANGQAAPGYNTVDNFRYNNGDTIAQSGGSPAWGQTYFTISYIANIASMTEAGSYTMRHVLVVVPTF